MISELITREEILEINKRYGGSLRSDAEIETALYRGKGKSVYKKITFLWRAILVGHPFTDGNKRTAFVVAALLLERSNIKLNEERKETILKELTEIAKENILDSNKIERRVRYAIEGR